jgi:competence protein ComEA
MAILIILKKYYRIWAVALGILLIMLIVLLNNFSQKSERGNPNSTLIESTRSEESKAIIILEITGQVNNPGVYEVNEKMMVIELINLAGGFTSYADLEAIHKNIGLSTFVEPHEKIYIPGIFENSANTSSSSSSGLKVSLNTATLDQLISLPDIGESTANKIMSSRPFTKLEDLKNVEGIGDKTYNNIVSNVTL